ncbi:hypothetical protein E2C01_006467 [Portunus trituberculatus]|uniref:Uncharacterized protein n=1 Tax=Portunus trituberculatus TaxID=210409 RepID=A0A5B7CV99_PORTR|nr:hypothetical protein [Portunus trituberculatus]
MRRQLLRVAGERMEGRGIKGRDGLAGTSWWFRREAVNYTPSISSGWRRGDQQGKMGRAAASVKTTGSCVSLLLEGLGNRDWNRNRARPAKSNTGGENPSRHIILTTGF